jgi:hypothetical protein
MDGDRLIVGSAGKNSDQGTAYLFTGVGTDFSGINLENELVNGSGVGSLPGPNTLELDSNDEFGVSLALSDDLMAVGAHLRDIGGTDRGAVFLFNGVGTDFSGLALQEILAHGSDLGGSTLALSDGDQFGHSVAMDGSHLLVGSPLDDTGGTNRGAVYIFGGLGTDFNALSQWMKLAEGSNIGGPLLNLSDNDYFGYRVAVDGDRFAVSAPLDDTGGTDRGAVYLFHNLDTGPINLGYILEDGVAVPGGPLTLHDSEHFGSALDLDGNLLGVGAMLNNGGGMGRGAVYLFNGVGTDFSGLTQQRMIADGSVVNGTPINLVDWDEFGVSIDIEGDLMVIGALCDDTGGLDMGALYLFDGVGSDFSTLNSLGKLADGSNVGNGQVLSLSSSDSFSSAVALDGDRLAVGSYRDDDGGSNTGSVYLFKGVGADFGGLILLDKLAQDSVIVPGNLGLSDFDNFGNAVALDGDLMAVGAWQSDLGGSARGSVFLFSGTGTDFSALNLEVVLGQGTDVGGGTLSLTDVDLFGSSVALDGDRLAVGALGDDTGGTSRGAVYLFNGVGTDFNGLTQQRKVAHGSFLNGSFLSLSNSDRFGGSVALDGDLLAIGAHLDDTAGTNRGAVYLLSGVGTDFADLTIEEKLTHGSVEGTINLVDGALFGWSVALDGNLLAVGAPNDQGLADTRGVVYLLNGVSPDFSDLVLQKRLTEGTQVGEGPLSLSLNDNFGSSVALSDGRLLVGASQDDTGGANRGAAYFFTEVGTDFSGLELNNKFSHGSGVGSGVLSLSDNDRFGVAAALDGDRMAVGSYYNDTGGTDRGSLYLFNGLNTGFGDPVLKKILLDGSAVSTSEQTLNLNTGDLFGSGGVALDGDLLAVGALADSTGGPVRGALYMFNGASGDFSGLTLQRKIADGSLINGTMLSLGDGDRFGWSVSLDGDRLAVGTIFGGTFGRGAVYLYNGVGSDFSGLTEQLILEHNAPFGAGETISTTSNGIFGGGVSLDGDYLAVGEARSGDGGPNRGAVWLFDGVGTDFSGLSMQRKLNSSSIFPSGSIPIDDQDRFGNDVSLSGGLLAVGAPLDDTGLTDAGSVYLFSGATGDFSGLDIERSLTHGSVVDGGTIGLGEDDQFGFSVDLDGTRLVVGAPGDRSAGGGGSVHLFDETGSDFGDLTLVTKLENGSELAGGEFSLSINGSFGRGLSLDGDRLAVGNGSLSPSGAVYLFRGLNSTSAGVVGDAQWSTNPGSTLYLTPGDLKVFLDAGVNTSLRANNDIVFNSPLTVDNPGGSGGSLSLMPGRSALFNADIITDGGSIFVEANGDDGPDGSFRDPGPAGIIMADGVTIDAGGGDLQFKIVGGTGPNTTSGNIVVENIFADHVWFRHAGPTDGSSILRASADSLISADSLFIDHDGPLNSSVGTFAEPLRVSLNNLGAHIHGASPSGIYIEDQGGVTVGGSFYGASHLIKGLETVTSGQISLTSTGPIDVRDRVATGGDAPIVLQGSELILRGFDLDAGNSTINVGSNLVRLFSDQIIGSDININMLDTEGHFLTLAAGADATITTLTVNDSAGLIGPGGFTVTNLTLNDTLQIDAITSIGNASLNGVAAITGNGDLTVLNGGTFANENDASVTQNSFTNNGTVNGNGTYNVTNFQNNGTVSPFFPGLLTVNGDFTQSAAGTYMVELAGTNTGEYDRISVSGTATLDGTVNVSSLFSYPGNEQVGDQFGIISAGTLTGNFATINASNGVTYNTVGVANLLVLDTVAIPFGGFTWVGPTTGTALWSDAANWGGTVPTDNSDVLIPFQSGGLTVVYDGSAGSTTLANFTTNENLTISGGSLTLGNASPGTFQFIPSTLLSVTGGALTIAQDTSIGNMTLSGAGTLMDGAADRTINGFFTFQSGTLGGSGTTTVSSSGSLLINAGSNKFLNSTLINDADQRL